MKPIPLLVIFTTLLSMIIVSVITVSVMPPRIVEFDIYDTIHTFQSDLAQTDLSDEKREQEIKRFTQTLDVVVAEYAKQHSVVVLVSPAVISGVKDATRDIQDALLQALKAQNNKQAGAAQ